MMTESLTGLYLHAATEANLLIADGFDEQIVTDLAGGTAGFVLGENSNGILEGVAQLLHRTPESSKHCLSLSDLIQFAELATDRTVRSESRFGALVLLACLASAYDPKSKNPPNLDLLSTASFSLLSELANDTHTTHGRFAAKVLPKLTTLEDVIDEAGLIIYCAAESITSGPVAEIAPKSTVDSEASQQLVISLQKVVPKTVQEGLSWLDNELWQSELPVEAIELEGEIKAYLCDLTGFNRVTSTLADDVERQGQQGHALRFARQSITDLLVNGYAKKLIGPSDISVYIRGNRGRNSTLLRTFVARLGQQSDTPVFGIIGMTRTKANQKAFYSLLGYGEKYIKV